MAPDSNPSWLGRYRLSSRIATGGMAEVYLGRRIDEDGSQGPAVAVKRLLPHMLADRRIVQMFLNEARITAQIHHPNTRTAAPCASSTVTSRPTTSTWASMAR